MRVGESCAGSAVRARIGGCNELHSGVAPDFSWLIATAKICWPRKTAEHLQAVTGASSRTVKYWLAAAHNPSGAPLLRLFGAIEIELEKRLEAVRERRCALE